MFSNSTLRLLFHIGLSHTMVIFTIAYGILGASKPVFVVCLFIYPFVCLSICLSLQLCTKRGFEPTPISNMRGPVPLVLKQVVNLFFEFGNWVSGWTGFVYHRNWMVTVLCYKLNWSVFYVVTPGTLFSYLLNQFLNNISHILSCFSLHVFLYWWPLIQLQTQTEA